MYPLDAMKTRFEAVDILEVPGLFTTQRVDRATVPKWMYLYEMQTDPEDWSQPCLIGHHITVEHFGTILTASPLPLPNRGYLDLSPGDFDERGGIEHLTPAEFEAKFLDPAYQPPQLPQRPKRRHSSRAVRPRSLPVR